MITMPEQMGGNGERHVGREDALDTVIALRRPEDYSPEQGARFEIHFEKLRNRVEGADAVPFEASLDSESRDCAIACSVPPG
jgi:putative DNA primase/helicase